MGNKELEKTLSRSLHRYPVTVNEKHFKDTLLLAEREVCQKQKRARISFIHFLLMQIKFIGWKIWTAQGILFFMISGALTRLYDKYYLDNPLNAARLLFCLSVLVYMAALPFIYRSVRCQMQEIEAATRFSSVRLLIARLLLIGIGNISVLSGIFGITMWKTSLRTDSAILYLCLPFLLAGSGCLFMLGHFTPKHFFVGSIGLCSLFIMAASGIFRHYEPLFRCTFSAGWFMVCIFLIAFCAYQFRYILYRSPYTEMQIA